MKSILLLALLVLTAGCLLTGPVDDNRTVTHDSFPELAKEGEECGGQQAIGCDTGLVCEYSSDSLGAEGVCRISERIACIDPVSDCQRGEVCYYPDSGKEEGVGQCFEFNPCDTDLYADFCYEIYQPVCSKNASEWQTSSNDCVACVLDKADGYIEGECQ